MGPSLEKLLSIATPPLRNADLRLGREALQEAGSFASSILELLQRRDGFFAFESALRFFPSSPVPVSYGVLDWNANSLWACEFGDMCKDCFFFAEDIFGGQFGISGDEVVAFDPETGEQRLFANSLEAWAENVLADFNVVTGYPLAHEWQSVNGRLAGRDRLVPKIPFVAGGTYSLENLVSIDAVEGMRARGKFARQIRDLPDGAQIRFQFVHNNNNTRTSTK